MYGKVQYQHSNIIIFYLWFNVPNEQTNQN